MKKLVIFDLDGTLLNTIADLAACTNHALAECGFPTHPESAYKLMVGGGIRKLFERALPDEMKTPQNIERLQSVFVPYYDKHGSELSSPYPGITDLLADLQRMGLATAVASNKYDRATRRLAERYFPDAGFSVVSGNREGVPVKPDPAIVRDILTATGYLPDDTLLVGDSGIDMQTAANAGVQAVGVTWGFRPRSELERYSPAHIIDDPAELIAILKTPKGL